MHKFYEALLLYDRLENQVTISTKRSAPIWIISASTRRLMLDVFDALLHSGLVTTSDEVTSTFS